MADGGGDGLPRVDPGAGGGGGGGGPRVVAAVGGLRAAWRGVYQKAAAVAEERARALLLEHVYHLHSRRALAVLLQGPAAGGLAVGSYCDLELPWAYVLEGWSLYADVPGELVLELERAASFADFPAMTVLTGAVKPFLDVDEQKHQDFALEGWTTRWVRGNVLRVSVLSVGPAEPPDPPVPGPTRVTLTLFLRAV